ncbi:hypothetical protein O181_075612, partial [Austropuccinia psidii MF-1]|nr:hypothetical protein [Austropuccinia psidii MF-1]
WMISNNNLMIFSKSYCPYCQRSKDFLNDKISDLNLNWNLKVTNKITFFLSLLVIFFLNKSHGSSNSLCFLQVLELNEVENGNLMQEILTNKLKSQKRDFKKFTVPQIFIHSKLIGGCDDLLTMEKKATFSNYALHVEYLVYSRGHHLTFNYQLV